MIENNTTTLSRGFNGLDLQFGDNCIVEGNTVHIDLGVEAIGIYVRKGASTADKRSRIVNNEVSVKSSDYTSAAIKVNGKTRMSTSPTTRLSLPDTRTTWLATSTTRWRQ